MADKHGLKDERLLALKNEYAMAMAMNKEELLSCVHEGIQRYMGQYIPAYGMDWDILLNEVYSIVQYYLPSIFFRNPRAFLRPRNKTFIAKKRNPVSGQMEEMELDSSLSAKTQEDILNYCLIAMKYKNEVRKVLMDALIYPHGILWHGYKGDFGMTEETSLWIEKDKVFVQRVSPMRFIKDPAVNFSRLEEARWVGRVIDVPLLDLIEDDKLDVDVKALKGFIGYGEEIGTATANKLALGLNSKEGQDYAKINAAKRAMIEFADKGYKNSKESKFVQVAELFVRPTKKEARDGKKGWIVLMCDEQDKPLRVNEWSIKAKGFPAHILQFNELPDSMFGMSDIDTYKQIADYKNVIVNLGLRNTQENSKVWVGLDGTAFSAEEDVDKIQKGDQTVIIFKGDGDVRGKMAVMSPGGQASQEIPTMLDLLQRNLEEKSGITDLKKGFLQSGEESATSVNIRNAGSSARPAYRQDMMSDFLKDSLHYINQLNKQFMPYKDAVRIVGSDDLEWSADPNKEEIQAETDVEIDVISMLPPNPQDELQQFNVALNMAIAACENPAVKQQIQLEGMTFELTPLVKKILDRMNIKDPTIFRKIKPEESQGFASVQQLRNAKDNVNASLSGTPIPHPPQATDDAKAHLEIYGEIAQILQKSGHVSDQLNQLIQIYTALLAQAQEQGGKVGAKPKFGKPTMNLLGGGGKTGQKVGTMR
jgi:hypothetical protein